MNRLILWLSRTLPKPWLFGLYGALGGLLGALVVGEAVWWALRPPPPAAASMPALRLAASPALEVYKGAKNRFAVKIARDGWLGPVTIKADEAPAGVRIDPVTVPEDRGDMEIDVRADANAPAGSGGIVLSAHGTPYSGALSAIATMRLTVREIPPPPPGLRIGVSPGVIVDQAGKNHFEVVIARDDFNGPVTVELSGLPAGVTAARPIVIRAEETKTEVEVHATPGATIGTEAVSVAATGPSGLPGAASPPKAFSRLELTVKAIAPPTGLRMAVSPGVVVDQGGKNRFGVIIARDSFRGPVTVELGDLPDGVTAAKTTLPDGVTTAEVEVQATAAAVAGTQTVSVTATGPGGPPGRNAPTAFSRLDLTVNTYKPPTVMVDVMFVLDVTGSMGWAINGVREGIIDFAAELERRQMDVRIGLTGFRDHLALMRSGTTKGPASSRRRRGAAGAGSGMFGAMRPLDLAPLPLIVGGEIFTKDYGAFAREVGESLRASGGGDGPESSLDALALAANEPFRENASRVLILITDAPPHIPDLQVQSLKQEVAILRKAKIDQLHLVIHNRQRPIYQPLQGHAPGSIFDLQEAARGKESFAALLPELSREIARIATASQPAPPPPAGSQPPPQPAAAAAAAALPPPSRSAAAPPPRPMALAADDLPPAPAPPPVLRGVQTQETFSAASTGRLLLAISAWTAAIAAMIAMALCAGQHYYLRQGWLHPSAALSGWVGGLVAGVAGGAAGQFLYQAAPGTPAAEALFRVLGWTLLGSMAGFFLAFFVPNLRSDRGMLGGALGGAAGAIGFLAVATAFRGLPGGDTAGRVLGAVLLGLALGLMLALAERIARKAWLEVCYGGGEFRTVNLGVAPVSIGSNSRASTIYARGAAPVAYRYWFLEGKVKREDVTTGAVTEAQPDQPLSVGAVVLTVHTAASATATAARAAPARSKAPAACAPPQPTAPRVPPVVAPAPPAVAPAPPVPAAVSTRPAPKPPALPPAAPPRVPPAAPTKPAPPAPAARQDSANCPGCGRAIPGVPGRRYCIACDLYL